MGCPDLDRRSVRACCQSAFLHFHLWRMCRPAQKRKASPAEGATSPAPVRPGRPAAGAWPGAAASPGIASRHAKKRSLAALQLNAGAAKAPRSGGALAGTLAQAPALRAEGQWPEVSLRVLPSKFVADEVAKHRAPSDVVQAAIQGVLRMRLCCRAKTAAERL